MRFVTVKHENNENCIRLVHLRERTWQAEDIPESLMRDLFDNRESLDEANDNEFFKQLQEQSLSL